MHGFSIDMNTTIKKLNSEIVSCRSCPRLVAWREEVARIKRPRYEEWEYWGKPVPGFGDPDARLLIVGLAPAAHGANRTGRMFTGDRSGDWLYDALHRFGFANTAESVSRDDGLVLNDCYITAAVRCAPPGNKPDRTEFENCRPYIIDELCLLKNIRVIVALGKIAFDTVILCSRELGWNTFPSKPPFKHLQRVKIKENMYLVGSYHPSQQNTFTGKLTRRMFLSVFRVAEREVRGGMVE
jgi:uracil-DNA glycosylase